MQRLGFDPGAISGTYGQGTAGGVAAWYKSKGYDAQEPSPTDQQQLGSLEQAVSAAQEALPHHQQHFLHHRFRLPQPPVQHRPAGP
ncbi:hypothetical protein ACRAWF_28290 [Streptomyces sp. L7]